MRTLTLVGLLACLSATAPTQNLTFYVNGLTGQDIATGGTVQQPWKTITYALDRIPVPTPPAAHTLMVAGGQTYSTQTNGEVFPLRAKFNVAVVGSGVRPVIEVPVDEIGYVYPPNTLFGRNEGMIENFVFRGGAVGIELGATTPFRHRPKVNRCEFLDQTQAGIRVVSAARSTNDPRFFDCRFSRCQIGLLATASGPGAVFQPDVDECVFDTLAGDGIFIQNLAGEGARVGGLVRQSRFLNTRRGLRVISTNGGQNILLSVEGCYFSQCIAEGLSVQLQDAGNSAEVNVTKCSFFNCTIGMRYGGTLSPGTPYRLTLTNNVATGSVIGFSIPINGDGEVEVKSVNNLAQRNLIGFSFVRTLTGGIVTFDSNQDRAFDNEVGISIGGNTNSGHTRVQSGMFCRNSIAGVEVISPMDFTLRNCTIADNAGVGLKIQPSGVRNIDHCIFDNVGGSDVQVPASVNINYSTAKGTTLVGSNNLNLTDPRLVRPIYKLNVTSPCIDAGDPMAVLASSDYEGDPRIVLGRSTGTPRSDHGADEYLPTGSVRPFGLAGTGRAGYFPEIRSSNVTAPLSNDLPVELINAINVAGVRPTASLLMLGFTEVSSPWPFELAAYGAPGCYFWQDLSIVSPPVSVDLQGKARFTFQLPNDPTLTGKTVVLQWLTMMLSANPGGFVTTQGLRVTVGS